MKHLTAMNLDRLKRATHDISDKVDIVRAADGPCMVDDALFGLEVELEMLLANVRGLRRHLNVVPREEHAEIG